MSNHRFKIGMPVYNNKPKSTNTNGFVFHIDEATQEVHLCSDWGSLSLMSFDEFYEQYELPDEFYDDYPWIRPDERLKDQIDKLHLALRYIQGL